MIEQAWPIIGFVVWWLIGIYSWFYWDKEIDDTPRVLIGGLLGPLNFLILGSILEWKRI